MATTTIAVLASTLIVAPSAHAADVNLESRTETEVKDGKIHAVYESYDFNVRPEDVSIRIRQKGSDQVLDTVRLTGTDECAPESECWDMTFRSEPVTLPEMGVYTMDVVVREGQSNELVDRDNGELNYALDPHLTVTSDRQWVSYDNQHVNVSGTLVAEDPHTHEVKPFAGAGLYYRIDPMRREGWLRTDDRGTFTDSLTFSDSGTDTQAKYMFDAETETLNVSFRKQDLKLKVDEPLGTVNAPYGSDVPVKGKLTRIADDGTEKPVKAYVEIADQKTVKTKEDGTFSDTFTIKQAGTVKVTPGDTGWLGWFNTPPVHLITVARPPKTSTFSSVKASVDKYRKVTFTGKVDVTTGSYPVGTTAAIAMEHSTDGRTWSNVGTFTAQYGATFSQSPAKKGSAGSHWRLRHTNAGLAGTAFKLGRKSTQLYNDDVTPEGVRKGTRITAKGGLLRQYDTSWKAFPGQTVRIYFKASTSGATWKKLGTATTRTDGTFSKKFTAQQDGTWQMRYIDTPGTHYADYGRQDFVDVR